MGSWSIESWRPLSAAGSKKRRCLYVLVVVIQGTVKKECKMRRIRYESLSDGNLLKSSKGGKNVTNEKSIKRNAGILIVDPSTQMLSYVHPIRCSYINS